MAGKPTSGPSDGHSRSAGSHNRPEKRQNNVQVPVEGEVAGSSDLVRGGPDRSRKREASDQNLDKSEKPAKKKLTLLEYNQTKEAAKAISDLNLPGFTYRPSMRSDRSPTPSPPPPRGGDDTGGGTEQSVMEDNFGFMDPGGYYTSKGKGKRSSKGPSITQGSVLDDSHQRNHRDPLQQSARNLLNQQQLNFMTNTGFHAAPDQHGSHEQQGPSGHIHGAQFAPPGSHNQHGAQSSGPGSHNQHGAQFAHGALFNQFAGHGQHGVQQQPVGQQGDVVGQGPPPNVMAQESTPSMSALALFMMSMNEKYTDMQQKQKEFMASLNSRQSDSKVKATTAPPTGASESSSGEDSEDEDTTPSSWSGLPPSTKDSSFALSPAAIACWMELLGIDEKGKKDKKFRTFSKYPNKIKSYTAGDGLMYFRCPRQNQELAPTGGWRLKQEDEMVALQKFSGAAGAALCLSVDNLRGTMDDISATMTDFQEGKFEDPGNEAVKVCASLLSLLEEGVIAHVVDALKFVASSFGAITLRRHTATLSQGYLSAEAKSVLEQSVPDEEFLFGREVKESVQKIRDTSLIKEVFKQKPIWNGAKNSGKKPWSGRHGGGGGKPWTPRKPKKNARSYDQRFKKGRKPNFEYDGPKKKRSDKKEKNGDD